jgi:hypothetical protein
MPYNDGTVAHRKGGLKTRTPLENFELKDKETPSIGIFFVSLQLKLIKTI